MYIFGFTKCDLINFTLRCITSISNLYLYNSHQNCHYDRCTQAFGESTRLSYIPEIGDRVLTPRPYVTHEEIEVKRRFLEKVCLIQRNFRAYLIRKLMKKCAAEWRYVI